MRKHFITVRGFMIKRKKIIAFSSTLLLLLIVLITVTTISNRKYNVNGAVSSATLKFLSHPESQNSPIVVTSPDDVNELLDCVHSIKSYNKSANPHIASAPHNYEIVFTYANGNSVTYSYRIYPSATRKNPFADFIDRHLSAE